jgi:hypothetical protein
MPRWRRSRSDYGGTRCSNGSCFYSYGNTRCSCRTRPYDRIPHYDSTRSYGSRSSN